MLRCGVVGNLLEVYLGDDGEHWLSRVLPRAQTTSNPLKHYSYNQSIKT